MDHGKNRHLNSRDADSGWTEVVIVNVLAAISVLVAEALDCGR